MLRWERIARYPMRTKCFVSTITLSLLCLGLAACDKSTSVGSRESICDDGQDNDGDGLIDCDDPDCEDDPACLPDTETICDDGIDNDRDGLTDCDDPDCDGDPACLPETETICDDGLDNDGDGLTDCADPDCQGNAACVSPGDTCADVMACIYACGAVSNYQCIQTCTGDGCDSAQELAQDVTVCAAQSCWQACQTDLADADCQSCIGTSCEAELAACLADTCPLPTYETSCDDGVDNDGDGLTDCDDPDCADHPACLGGEITCGQVLSCAETCGTDTTCIQACQEAGCPSAQHLSEALISSCGEACVMSCLGGLGSPQCQTCIATTCPDELAACMADDCLDTVEWHCSDGVDNDGDGQVDCDDPDCTDHPDCRTGGLTCSEILDCAVACGNDMQCRQACVAEGCTDAQTAYSNLRNCRGQNCWQPCQTPGSQDCTDCMNEFCSAELTACQDSTCP